MRGLYAVGGGLGLLRSDWLKSWEIPAIARSLGQQFGQQFGQLGQLFAVHCEALDRERCHQDPLCFFGSHLRRTRLGRVSTGASTDT